DSGSQWEFCKKPSIKTPSQAKKKSQQGTSPRRLRFSEIFSDPKPGSALLRSANRASTGASAAINAGIGIDHIFAVALRDGSDGTFTGAGAAVNAFIVDDIGHGQHLHL